jgi:hypothetical protein
MINPRYFSNCLDDLNQTLFKHCSQVEDNGELAAMAGWVNTPCLKDLNRVFKKWSVDGNTIEFKLAWIDKSPIATYVPQGQTAAVSGELADLAIIRLHLNRQQLMQNGYMLLLKAKAAKSGPPFVPSTNCAGQTPKEWKFMTSWPPFTLRTWAASSRITGPTM